MSKANKDIVKIYGKIRIISLPKTTKQNLKKNFIMIKSNLSAFFFAQSILKFASHHQ